ncbi:MAG TPA: hypothetical protein ENJ82_16485, partial [Bacteroidetes bacterium]|nr:hypothetical protein [Bacteroidota bacterium]
MMQEESPSTASGGIIARLFRLIPTETWILGLLGIAFYLVARRPLKEWLPNEFAYDIVLRFRVPIAFGVAALYAWSRHLKPLHLGPRKLVPGWFAEIALSLAAVFYIIIYDPIIYVDDVGFILRYLDNFQEGCFYCFNMEDGPVFGISSFIYGLLAGGLNWLHIMSPETSINFLTYAGVFTTTFLLFRILRHIMTSQGAVFLMVLLILTCGKSVLFIFNSGMESPMHLSIVLAAFLFFLQKKDRWMWLFLALATISKLDVVPLVLVIGLFWLIENFGELRHISWRNPRYRHMILFGILPVLIWVGFALLVFGSPLPQSAYAKVYFHSHAKGTWFPFLDHFVKSNYRSPFLYTMLGLLLLQLIFALIRGKGGRQLVFGMSFIGTMTLYYFYNPGERMQWYYTLPETLMFTQLAISAYWLLSSLGKRWTTGLVGLVVGTTFLLSWTRQRIEVEVFRNYEYVVETERTRIGEYLGSVISPQDTLLAGHGLNARHCKGYVIDQTGLNSRLMTQFERKTDSVLKVLKPHWIVMHGWKWETP